MDFPAHHGFLPCNLFSNHDIDILQLCQQQKTPWKQVETVAMVAGDGGASDDNGDGGGDNSAGVGGGDGYGDGAGDG
jgi:hypothetical protein